MGLVGYFASSDRFTGADALNQATKWFREKHGIKKEYGPIHGTITSDYRLNLADNFSFPGEPVNPKLHIEAFQEAGFHIFNRYVSGIARHYSFFIKFFTQKPSREYSHMFLRPFDVADQHNDLKIYHKLMNAIFPSNSIYCPTISFEEREYNVAVKDPIFNPLYTYFLKDKNKSVGFVISYPYKNQLILKTIGLLPEYRGKHLSGILIKKVHDQANQDGLEAAIYAMIRVGNLAFKMKRPGVKIYRKYVTMYKNL